MRNLSKIQTGLLAGSTINLVFSFFNYGLRFVVSIIVARALGASGKGVYILILTTGSLLALFLNLGFSGSLTYLSASKEFNAKDLFGFSFWASLVTSLLGGLLFLAAYWLVFRFNVLKGVDLYYIGLVLFFIPASLITTQTNSLLLGKQQILAVNLVDTFRAVANLILQLAAWQLDLGINGAVGAWLLANFAALCAALWLGRDLLSIRLSSVRNILNRMLNYGLKSYLSNLLSFFNYRLDSYLVNFFLGTGQVGLYTTGVSLAELLWYVPNAVSGALFPKIPTLDSHTAGQVTARTLRQVFAILLFSSIAFGLAGQMIIVAAYGQEFQSSTAPFLWLLPGIVGMAVSKIISTDLSGRGKPEYATRTSGITLLITIAGDILLIPAWGISGAAIASSLAYITSAVFSVAWFYRETGIGIADMLILKLSDIQFIKKRLSSLIKGSIPVKK